MAARVSSLEGKSSWVARKLVEEGGNDEELDYGGEDQTRQK